MSGETFTMPEHEVHLFEQAISKEDIPVVATRMVESVLENGNPLEVAEKIKVFEEIIDAVKKDKRFKDYAIEEVAKYGKAGYISPTGVKIELSNSGGRYNYDSCNDPVIKDLEAKLKERQEYLKHLPREGVEVIDKETGNIDRIYPAGKPASVETIKITLSKK